jgi:hypothetical protein
MSSVEVPVFDRVVSVIAELLVATVLDAGIQSNCKNHTSIGTNLHYNGIVLNLNSILVYCPSFLL